MQAIHRCLLVLLALLTASSARAEVVALKILKREPFAGGKVFGEVGPYEQITALARFAIDPKVAQSHHRRSRAAPPASVYPRFEERTLVTWTREATGFSKIPGVRFPMVIQQPSYND